ncbi:Centlein, partial [Nibea albiflora]
RQSISQECHLTGFNMRMAHAHSGHEWLIILPQTPKRGPKMSDARIVVLEEQVKSLSDELMQCQADKEFVWSLWKRLQVANPDLTQAVSLVVEREKHKAEIKDRKVLEILQSKDYTIQELEQKVTGQQQEINNLAQRRTTVGEESALMKKELTVLREQLVNKSQELKEMKTECRRKEEEERQVVRALEEEKEGLSSRCAALRADLEEKERQANSQRDQRDAAQARVKKLEEELHNAWQELSTMQSHSSSLAAQLSAKEREMAAKEGQLSQLRRECAEVQTLYRQSTEHAAEQNHLIKQLEGLNLDTQKVLRNQEEAHTADTTSYQRAAVSEQVDTAAQRSSPDSDWASTRDSDPRPEDKTLHRRSTSSARRQQGAPVQRSRSLSPASSVELGSGRGRGRGAEKRIQDLEELLKLKMEENEELRSAHDKRRERLCLIQSNYKTVRDQLKEMEKSNGVPGGRMQRAEPWQLRQENSDAVWNELAYLKNLTRKLSIELLHKVVEERQVKSSTPKKLSVSSERMEQSFKKIEQLERRMLSLEEETEKLREEKEQLLEAKEDLARNCCRLKASLDHLRTQEAVREEAAQAQALAQEERHRGEIVALEARISASHKEITKLHQQLLKLRQELGILRAARDFYKNRALGPARAGGITSNISSKVKFKTTRLRGPLRQHSHRTVSPNQAISWQGRSPSPTKDEWEDMSIDSDSGEEYSDSLNGVPSRTTTYRRRANRKQRVESLQRHIDILRSARKDAVLSARELRRANEKITAQLNSLTEKLCSSKQLTQKLTSDLAGTEQQKKVLEMELEQWRQITFPQQTAPPPPAAAAPPPPPTPPVNTECSCLGRTMPTPTGPAPQALEAEVKQLQTRLKSASAEVTRQVAANKALRGQLQEKEDKLRQLQDNPVVYQPHETSTRTSFLTTYTEMCALALSYAQTLQTTDCYHYNTRMFDEQYCQQAQNKGNKRVKTLSEEANNRKALIESLKRRLNVATTEKSQYEALSTKLKEDLEKKEQRIHALQARVGAGEQALAALQQTATEQMEGLTQQSTHALDRLQRQLGQAYSQLEELHSFIKALASEILLDVQEVKQQLMKRRRLRQGNAVAAKGGLSAKSMIKAKSIAASILNMSENDLADIMDTDQ